MIQYYTKNVDEKEVDNTPQTLDNIFIYICLFSGTLLLIPLVAIIIKRIINKSKKGDV